jgi:hypothetical protein
MRPSLPVLLAHIAALVYGTSGCSLAHSSCDGFVGSPETTVTVTGDVACEIQRQSAPTWYPIDGGVSACGRVCGPNHGGCSLPDAYIEAFLSTPAVSLDGGPVTEPDTCPTVTGAVELTCGATFCEGRRTGGVDEPALARSLSTGDYLAACSYLEATSVHAFARLAIELEAHGAPRELVDAALAARDDEVRHAEATRALARRFGVEAKWPDGPPSDVRSLATVARENAVEGCVRETYGAVLACVRAAGAADPEVRAAMTAIAPDECRHADLSWRIDAWAVPRLTERDREVVRAAMHDAARALSEGDGEGDERLTDACRRTVGMPTKRERRRVAELLDAKLFRATLELVA